MIPYWLKSIYLGNLWHIGIISGFCIWIYLTKYWEYNFLKHLWREFLLINLFAIMMDRICKNDWELITNFSFVISTWKWPQFILVLDYKQIIQITVALCCGCFIFLLNFCSRICCLDFILFSSSGLLYYFLFLDTFFFFLLSISPQFLLFAIITWSSKKRVLSPRSIHIVDISFCTLLGFMQHIFWRVLVIS